MFLSALKILFICLEVIVCFNLMIIVHELGHFLAARWRGLVIEKFGIWFGKPLWEKKINGVTYSLGSIPAGGFVALPQLAPMEVMEGKVESSRDQLPPITALDKIIVAFAGPLFSFLLAVVFAVIVWQVGRPVSEAEATTVVGVVAADSPASKAGILPGDKILSVDGHAVSRFNGMGSDSITWCIVRSEGETIPIELERKVDGATQKLLVNAKPELPETKFWTRKGYRQIKIAPAELPVVGEVDKGSAAEAAGLKARDVIVGTNGKTIFHAQDLGEALAKSAGEPLKLTVERDGKTFDIAPIKAGTPIIAEVMKGYPAEAAGLKAGDRVLSVDNQPAVSSTNLTAYVRGQGLKPIVIAVERDGKKQDITVTPAPVDGETRPMIGVAWQDDLGVKFDARGRTTLVHPSPFEQVRAGVMSIFNTIGAVASRKSDIKLQHMGGPVMMMRVYYNFFQMDFADGWRMAFWFSVVLNVNLAMINMLPIPVLDGGHITLALVEAIRRKPVNVRVLETIQSGCAILIIGFMVYIMFFDVQDLFPGDHVRKSRPVPAATPAPAEAQK